MTLSEPTFPPLLDGRVVIKGGDPRTLAIKGAIGGELGAGDTLWLQDTEQVHIAIVLEPDDVLEKSAQMLPLGMAAAGECLAALVPPQVGINYRWPGTILINGASAGVCTLTVPADCSSVAVPTWMVLDLSLRFAFDQSFEPGATPGITSLVEEGIEELTTVDVLESYSRHFLSLLDTWTNDGFADVTENWFGRLEGIDETVSVPHPKGAVMGRTLGLDENGNLLVRLENGDNVVALLLLECIERAASPFAP